MNSYIIKFPEVPELDRIINVFFTNSWRLKLKTRAVGLSTMFAQEYDDARDQMIVHLLTTSDLGDLFSIEEHELVAHQ